MPKRLHIQPSDIKAISELITEAIVYTSEIVEDMQNDIVRSKLIPFKPVKNVISNITHLSHSTVRGISKFAGKSIALGTSILPDFKNVQSSEERDTIISIVNGIIGDYLKATENELQIGMTLRNSNGESMFNQNVLLPTKQAKSKLLIAVHGLCMNNYDWTRKQHNHAEAIAKREGYSLLYLHYNSGLHIAENGKQFNQLLHHLERQWPTKIEEITLLTHSMGGLVSRSAIHVADGEQQRWRKLLRKVIFLGTPHHGAPLERAGNYVDFLLDHSLFAKALSRIGKLRSAGITDLRYGSILEEDISADRFEMMNDQRTTVPLPKDVDCFAIAANSSQKENGIKREIIGDGLVLPDSALGKHDNPDKDLNFKEENTLLLSDLSHFDLLSDQRVFHKLIEIFR